MAALAGLTAHGGVLGAAGEIAIAVGVAAFFFAIWLRERRHTRAEGPVELRDEEP